MNEFSLETTNSFKDFLSQADLDRLSLTPISRKAHFVVENSSLNADSLAEKLAQISKLEYLKDFEIAPNAEKILSVKLICEYQCLPSKESTDNQLVLVSAWIPSEDEVSWIISQTGRIPIWKISSCTKIAEKISQSFGIGSDSLGMEEGDEFADINDDDIAEDENAAIIKFVSEIITKALADRATDIHIEPQKNSLTIRYRIDGNLLPVKLPENLTRFKDAIISRLKIMARLNISEKRRPQDGRINFVSKSGSDIDIRISSLPTMYGESISLRLLTQKSQPVTIADLGFMTEDQAKLEIPLSRPHGIILVTGPTGSGKSTTLTAFIRKLRNPEVRIITVEDPVEYEVEGVNQTQVQAEIGLTFSAVLRSVLRQDPDIIMVGEIRDRETADIAIRASLTGHLVLSTLHTNDASGALTRLIDMDIEPFLIASSVEMILAQRLVRKLCTCKQPAMLDSHYLESCLTSLGIKDDNKDFSNIHKAVGCPKCRSIGYYGRLGIFEILLASDALHDMIINRRTARDIRNAARKGGMRTLQECGWQLVKNSLTGLEEIMAYAHSDE